MNGLSAYAIPGLKSEFMPKREPVLTEFKRLMPNAIIDKVSEYLGIPVKEIKRKCRKKEIVYARKICVYLIRENTELSLESVGSLFSNALTDHTSVLHCQTFISNQVTGRVVNKHILYDLQAIRDMMHGVETIKHNSIKQ